ncbi:MAG: hypothetical protein MHM6MM_004177 [Cercozoa sp. M6MM]
MLGARVANVTRRSATRAFAVRSDILGQTDRELGRETYATSRRQEEYMQPKKEPVRVTVTGAAGQIGYSLLPRIASGEMLGPDQPVILNLLDIPAAEQAMEGVKMELQDCAFPLLENVVCTSDAAQAFDSAEYALLVGAKPRGPGMERKDLLVDNGALFKPLGEAINKNAKRNVKVLVVGNPANTNCLIAAHNAPDVPKENFSALTRLDHDRLLAQLCLKLGCRKQDLERVAIWGNHSSTMVPDITYGTVATTPIADVIGRNEVDQWFKDELVPTVQQRGAAIIAARGASSAASAANASLMHMRDLALGSDHAWTSMAVYSADNNYGIDENLYYSFPVITYADGRYEVVSDLEIDAHIAEMMKASEQELIQERDAVASLL